MRKTKTKEKTLIQLADSFAEKGTLVIAWDGGNDSGGCWMKVDGERMPWNDTDADRLVNLVENALDYGSWAGEFQAHGEAIYDPETKTFSGNDHYSYDTHDTVAKCKVKIELPDILWFDRLDITVRGYIDDMKIEANFFTRARMVNPKLARWEEIMEHEDGNLFKQIQTAYDSVTENDVESFWESIEINFNEFKKIGNKYVAYITELGYSYGKSEDKSIVVDLKDIDQ